MIGRNFSDPLIQRGIKWWPFEVIEKNSKIMLRIETAHQSVLFKPESLYANLLKYMKLQVELFTGEIINRAAITVPSTFDLNQRNIIENEATKIGLRSISFVNETIDEVKQLDLIGQMKHPMPFSYLIFKLAAI